MERKLDTDTMEAYRRQMMEMYRTSTASPTILDDDNWLDSRYPEPDIARDTEALAPSIPPEADNTDFVGYLRAFAFTAGGAEPIEGARVIVTRDDSTQQTIFANLTTDRDGFTPVIALPTVDPELSLQPGNIPYITYNIRISADGFRTAEHRNVPIYGNSYVTQPAALIPILPNGETDTQEFVSGGPTNLQGGGL